MITREGESDLVRGPGVLGPGRCRGVIFIIIFRGICIGEQVIDLGHRDIALGGRGHSLHKKDTLTDKCAFLDLVGRS